jgi:hypothetical protein
MTRKDGILARSVKFGARMDKLGVFDIGHLGKERLAAAVTFDPHNLLPVTIERLAYLRATIEQQGLAGRPRELGIIEGPDVRKSRLHLEAKAITDR